MYPCISEINFDPSN